VTRRALDQEKALRPYVSADWVLSKSSWNGNCCARMQGADAIDSERGAGGVKTRTVVIKKLRRADKIWW
jgi:hypothetical protein